MLKKTLSKSSYIAGIQCQKLLWIKINDKERFPDIDESTLTQFNNGHKIGKLAQDLFPDGINIPYKNFSENLNNTKILIKKRIPLFEPAFLIGRLYSRADILVPVEENSWDIYEVKSSTKVKDINLHDVGFQRYVYEKAGLKIRNTYLVHINNQYILEDSIDIQKLFTISNITEKVNEVSVNIELRINKFLKIIDSNEPFKEIGAFCNSPYECELKEECWSEIPKKSVFDLYNGRDLRFELYNMGIKKIADIPLNIKLSAKQLIQKSSIIKNTPYINNKGIRDFLDNLEYPINYLDFETINPAIPKYKNMRPFQKVPFQFSLHIQNSNDSKPCHISFLHKTNDDPRPDFLKTLKNSLSKEGTILVYNKSFEAGILKELENDFDEYKEWYNKIKGRIVDLLELFRNFHYYHPNQEGSVSIKNILPTFTDLNYKDLEIGRGDIANIKYEKALSENTTEEEKEEIFKNLKEYCFQDTLAELKIIEGLKNLL